MDEDSLTQEGLDASAIAVGGSFDQGPRRATIARESGWHEIYHELEQPMSEVEEADPLPPPKVVISRAASPPVQQSKPVRMKLSGLLYGNAELQEVDKAVAMRVTLEEINRMNEPQFFAVWAAVEAVHRAELRLSFPPLWQLHAFLPQHPTGGHQNCNVLQVEEESDVAKDILVPDDQGEPRLPQGKARVPPREKIKGIPGSRVLACRFSHAHLIHRLAVQGKVH